MRKLFSTAVVFITILCTSPNLFSQGNSVFLNPGIKLGYTYGENGGFTYGFELSVTSNVLPDEPTLCYGVVFDIDFNKHWTKIHFGAEGNLITLGLDIGPTLLIQNGTTTLGFSIIPYCGALLYLYYNYSYFGKNMLAMSELGMYLKYHTPIIGEGFHYLN